jgi:hypothetical protein
MTTPNERRREDLAVAERRKNIARRYLRGELQSEIARAFELSQPTVSRELRAIQKQWLASAALDRGLWTAEQLAKIDEVERHAWLAWAKSQEAAETLRAKMRGDQAETEKITKGQAGDAAFLHLILQCVARRCELLGLNAPKEVRVDGLIDIKTILAIIPAEP